MEGGERMADRTFTREELNLIADEVIDMLRPKGLAIADVRDVIKLVDENLEFEVLQEKK